MKMNRTQKIVSIISASVLLLGLLGWLVIYPIVSPFLVSNTAFEEKERVVLLLPHSTAADVGAQLKDEGVVKSGSSLRWCLTRLYGKDQQYSGRYIIPKGTPTHRIALLIGRKRQTPLMLVVPSVRTLEELAGRLGRQLAIDSLELLHALHSKEVAQRYNFTVESLPSMIIPNSYEVYWDCTLEQLFNRLHKEYQAFWTERKKLAHAIGLDENQVYTLASIIQEEVMKPEEMPTIAGVYMNRLAKGMYLQACPTAKYAAGNLGMSRVYRQHTEIESPYNTYLHEGLPPGPIRITSIAAIDAVLHYEKHNYLYFCAREDFSGYHHFSRDGVTHLQHARQYRRALNARQRQ